MWGKGFLLLNRNLGLTAYHDPNHPDSVKEFYSLLVPKTEKLPWTMTRYRYNQDFVRGLTSPSLFRPLVNPGKLLSRGIDWLTWKQLRKILEITKGHFRTEAEKRFVDDLITYLDYKIQETDRIRTERKQLSFW